MRNSIFAALMAATALIPGAAMAQRGDGDRNGWNRNDRAVTVAGRLDARQDRPERAQRPDRPQQAQPQPQQQPQPQTRPDRGDGGPRGDRGRGDGGQRPDRGGDRGGFDGRGQGGNRPDQPRPAPVTQPDRGNNQWRGNDNRGGNNQWRGNDNRGGNNQWRGNDNRGGNNQWRGNDNRVGNNQWRGNDNRGGNQWRGNDNRGGNWNRGWRQDNRYDWNRRRQYNRSAFHLPRYYAPSNWGYGYRRFNIGFTLNSGLFQQNYWISNADYYGLPEAYGPYRWVRYYNDALLVDVYSGEVVDTVYDIFW